MFCSKCGNQVPDGVEFCVKCGNPMGNAGAAPAGGATPPPVQPYVQPAPAPAPTPDERLSHTEASAAAEGMTEN